MTRRAAEDLSAWTTRPRPPRAPIEGRFVRAEPFELARHAAGLFEAYRLDEQGELWRYLPYGPFADIADYEAHARKVMNGEDPFFFAFIDPATEKPIGVASLMRIVPEHGVIETGHLCYSPLLQRTPAATEAMYLFATRVFDDLGYRRYEWKCDNANAPSKRAAERLGFRFEGVFRKHLVVKGRNRDTAWFSITDDEWPRVRAAYRLWLSPENFDAEGRQKFSLLTLNATELADGGRTLRRADMADIEMLTALQKAAYARNREILGVEPVPLRWDYRQVLADREVWMLEESGELAGALILVPYFDHLCIDSIAVAPTLSGQGIGNALLSAAETRAGNLGIAELRLITGERLKSNVDWYRRKGYEVADVEQAPDRRIVYMRRRMK